MSFLTKRNKMSRLANAAVSSVLLALAVTCCLAGPVSNAVTENGDPQEYSEISKDVHTVSDNDQDSPLLREKRQFRLNEYQILLYLNFNRLKALNCTEDFLNQTVSPHFCSSQWVIYTLLRAKVERFGDRNDPMAPFTYELCSNVTLFNDEDMILGHDFVIYRRYVREEVPLEVFLLRIINERPLYMDLVSHRTIPANSSGWQVFHLDSRIGPLVEKRVCVIMFVRETLMNETRPLNRSELAERFVLDEASPSEASNKPFTTSFIISNGTLPFGPFFGKRSVENPDTVGCSTSTECMLQSHIVDLASHLGVNILYPPEADLGRCDSEWQSTAQDYTYDYYPPVKNGTANESGSGKDTGVEEFRTKDLYRCVPIRFDDLLVLVNFYDTIVLISVPDLVITECGTKPCSEMEEEDTFY